MDDLKLIYDEFVLRCEDIRRGKFIMSKGMITKLLGFIAKNHSALDFLASCNRMYDFRKEYNIAVGHIGSSDIFKLPDNNIKIVTLVTGLLYEIDRQKIDFLQFLKSYFDCGAVDANFECFCIEVIDPYARAFAEIVNNVPIAMTNEDEGTVPKQLSQSITEQLLPYAEALSQIIVEDSSISEQKREEYLDMLEGLCYAMEKANSRLLKYMWIGLNSVYQKHKLANSYLSGIRSVLITFGVIDR